MAGFSGDGGPAVQAQINRVVSLATDSSGNVYLADENNHRVRKVDASGVITTFAGTGVAGFSGDGGSAQQAQLNHPTGVCVSPQGDIYVNDLANYRVRKISPGGTITTVAGNGSNASSGDGAQATQAGMALPIRCAVDSAGNLYIADQGAARVRKVDVGGTISTLAGNGNQSFSGDGGAASAAGLNNPTALAVDGAGNVYITDQFNQRIRMVDTSGKITTVAGNGSIGFSGDGGSPTLASFNYPGSIALDPSGALYVVDCTNNRLRKISGGVINTIAGTGGAGFGGDGGPALQAVLDGMFALARDGNGNLYLGDFTNSRVRVIKANAAAPAITEVDNGFSNVPNSPIQAGSWVVVKGTNLSNTPGRGWNANENFPTSMDGTSVTVNGKSAFLYYISPTQVNFQAPTDTAVGPVQVVVSNNGAVSASATVQLQAFSPALLQWGGGQYPYAEITRNPDNAFVGNPAVVPGTVAAKAGDVLTLWVTGLGATNPAVPAGQQPVVVNGSLPVPTTPMVTLGGTNVTVLGAILRYAGLYQVNIQIPASAGTGNLPIQVQEGSYQSPANVLLTVQ